jgi:GH25 family lysozyme M1 (1,4-beta-N-acetylmuramidase)
MYTAFLRFTPATLRLNPGVAFAQQRRKAEPGTGGSRGVALVRGIDVSRFQTVTSLASVRKAGYRFVIVKASERNDLASPVFPEYYGEARATGLLVGSYHFGRPGQSPAKAQATYYVSRLRAGGFEPGRDLPPVLDIEDAGGLSKTGLTNWCLDFVREVDRRLGLTDSWHRCGIYTTRDHLAGRLDGKALLNDRWLWLAAWPAGLDQPTRDDQLPDGAALWQWTDQGRVPGIPENTNLNVAREADLRKLAPGGEEEEMPVFRHYGVQKAIPVKPSDSQGRPYARALDFDIEWADPAPVAHTLGTSSYTRTVQGGWSSHELSGLRIEGMADGDGYQLQLIIVHPSHEEIVWSAVLAEGVAAGSSESISVSRTLRSGRDQRVRWRFLYFGKAAGVRITRAEWVIREYPA